ncbi:ParB/RepB/Spo0J family partition protein [Halomonas sp. 86]|uniref:ParB/RepB/Spo0J family partition protein n=1 Tax=unclassified Halomonas TaxID=2609666 RepID=UPI00403495FA
MTMAQSMDKLHRTKQAGIGKGNMFKAMPQNILEKEGFNPRDYNDPETAAHIRQLADAYKAGRHVPAITVKVVDGKIYVVEGHCRRRGMLLAIEEGADLGMQPVNEFHGDDEEAEFFVITSQSGKKLTPTELAQMYSRLINRGKTEGEIAESVGKTAQHVSQYLTVHRMPTNIKKLIDTKVVSMSLALETYNELGTAAAEILAEGVETSLKAGKKKLTKKTLQTHQEKSGHQSAQRRLTKKVIAEVSDHVAGWGGKFDNIEYDESDMATVQLSKDEVEALQKLRDLLASPTEQEDAQERATVTLGAANSDLLQVQEPVASSDTVH